MGLDASSSNIFVSPTLFQLSCCVLVSSNLAIRMSYYIPVVASPSIFEPFEILYLREQADFCGYGRRRDRMVFPVFPELK